MRSNQAVEPPLPQSHENGLMNDGTLDGDTLHLQQMDMERTYSFSVDQGQVFEHLGTDIPTHPIYTTSLSLQPYPTKPPVQANQRPFSNGAVPTIVHDINERPDLEPLLSEVTGPVLFPDLVGGLPLHKNKVVADIHRRMMTRCMVGSSSRRRACTLAHSDRANLISFNSL